MAIKKYVNGEIEDMLIDGMNSIDNASNLLLNGDDTSKIENFSEVNKSRDLKANDDSPIPVSGRRHSMGGITRYKDGEILGPDEQLSVEADPSQHSMSPGRSDHYYVKAKRPDVPVEMEEEPFEIAEFDVQDPTLTTPQPWDAVGDGVDEGKSESISETAQPETAQPLFDEDYDGPYRYFPEGSLERKKEYDRLNWAYDETINPDVSIVSPDDEVKNNLRNEWDSYTKEDKEELGIDNFEEFYEFATRKVDDNVENTIINNMKTDEEEIVNILKGDDEWKKPSVREIDDVKWDDGNQKRKSEYYVDADGNKVKDGQFSTYREDGTILMEGQYEDGKHVGVWKEYHKDGTTLKTTFEMDGKKRINVKEYDTEGNLRDFDKELSDHEWAKRENTYTAMGYTIDLAQQTDEVLLELIMSSSDNEQSGATNLLSSVRDKYIEELKIRQDAGRWTLGKIPGINN